MGGVDDSGGVVSHARLVLHGISDSSIKAGIGTDPDSVRGSFRNRSLTPWSLKVRDRCVDSISPLKSLLFSTVSVSLHSMSRDPRSRLTPEDVRNDAVDKDALVEIPAAD